jgi:DNA polymerase III sliding clamp (beta) subunit (PCNA family)
MKMKMKRTELLDSLQTVAPALARNNLIPIQSHLWFLGTHVMAYHHNMMTNNDQIAIKVPCKTDFVGAVPGELIDLLKNSKATDVELQPLETEAALQIKAAGSQFKLSMLPSDSFVFTMPKLGKHILPVPIIPLLDAIETCMRSVGSDQSNPQGMGITLIANDKSVSLYSTNDATLSYAKVTADKPITWKGPVILSSSFCEQLLKLDGDIKLEILDDYDYALAVNDSGVVLFGRLISVTEHIDFASVVEASFPKNLKKNMVPIPKKLRSILGRAIVINEPNQKYGSTRIAVKDGWMQLFTITGLGGVYDEVLVEGHPDVVSVTLSCKHIKAGLAFDKMLITDQCLIMADNNALYLLAANNV